jgi:hypothetical protein
MRRIVVAFRVSLKSGVAEDSMNIESLLISRSAIESAYGFRYATEA